MNPRLFLAVPVRLYDFPQIRVQFDPLIAGRWRDESGLHVTIAFSGERFSPDAVVSALEGLECSFDPSLLGGWDYFPRSRVFVATTSNSSLQSLHDRLVPRLDLPEKLLNPHVTLMRVRTFTDREAFDAALRLPPPHPLGELEPRMVLYRSDLHPGGAVYTPLHTWETKRPHK